MTKRPVKDHVLQIRLSDKDEEALRVHADANQMPLATWARWQLLKLAYDGKR